MSTVPAGWEVVIGLETHTQLSTSSKIFSGSATTFGAAPNTQANVVDLALPGTLPVLNRGAVEKAIMFGLAVNGTIASHSVFARKNYFYPDLPKGYQISQFELPVVVGGKVPIVLDGVEKTVQLTRAHLEEDAGKSLHEGLETMGVSGIDLNRAGTPLLEIVTEPDMRSSAEAVAYAKALHGLVTWLGICDGNMQEGSFRCDANVSVRPKGQKAYGTRCEIKNVNSFKFLERAIEYEIRRQIELIEDGGRVVQETRLYDADRDETRSMRSKEDAMDYRYFPDPDLLPLVIDAAWIDEVQLEVDARGTPASERKNLEASYGLSTYDASLLCREKALADYFEVVIGNAYQESSNQMPSRHETNEIAKICANWVINEIVPRLDLDKIPAWRSGVSANTLGMIIRRQAGGVINAVGAKKLFAELWAESRETGFESQLHEDSVDERIESDGLRQISDAGTIEKIVDEVLAANQKSVEEFKSGKEKAFQALVGQVMKASKGKANPAQVNEILKKKLSS
jgi:aspartyl-tRNA(Asn)/glutamyl-tRNA(Gln) amidotransferase subunit B